MSTLNRARRLLLRGVAVLLLGSAFAGEPRAQTIFSDDFNRPDGTVGNGWSSWWDGAFDHSNIALVNGELVTRGFPNQAGGVFRTLPIAFPAAFAFDFRTPLTVADNQCSTLLYNEGGWLIAFNAATPAFTPLTPVQPGAAYVLSVRRFEKRRPLLRSVRRYINLGSNGTVPVAILGAQGFDAAAVDPLTVTLSGARVRLRGKGTPMASLEDINGDGLKDLLIHVSTEALELSTSDTQAVLKGKTFGGAAFTGSDSVRRVP